MLAAVKWMSQSLRTLHLATTYSVPRLLLFTLLASLAVLNFTCHATRSQVSDDYHSYPGILHSGGDIWIHSLELLLLIRVSDSCVSF